ncbi:sigma-70 family RNA polymerase sigma factor [Actinomadura sp. 7K507]|uniref:RNA polymerase sigma factor n=1 Tax=Actinomadura sp. 7K507 TaxID=2530365 RepID=UPI00104FC3D9|nr:sigma-70 family RNA polymerase sigma factor [Actinomadura sp. 7K507]TDC79813.1 sigma-70 family RNA polymerase sigma factor [Actinomadura sp. 7K507]
MNDHLLVEALRERDPDAPAALYDAHADRLYAYCWFQLRNRDAAQVALRDTFIGAEAHIGRLRDPGRFAPWLYAIARLECARRLPPREQPPDVPVASHDQEDVDQRIMAWQAVLALTPLSREILDLRVRHQLSLPDLAAVFDVPLKDAQSSLDRAHGEIEEALTAEMLAHQGPYGCAERAVLLRERHGALTHDLNGRLMEHSGNCSVCCAFRPRTVSAAKVYGLLPDPGVVAELRLRVMSCFLDPELVGYRLFVATRITEFTPDGFPVQATQPARPPWPPGQGRRTWLNRFRRTRSTSKEPRLGAQAVRAAVVLIVVGVLSGGGVASMYGLFDTGRRDADTVAGPRPSAVPGVSQRPEHGRRSDHPDVVGYLDASPVSATFPLGARASSAPPTALRTPSSPAPPPVAAPSGSPAQGTLAVSPLFLDLAGGSDGSIALRAEGGQVAWQATSRGGIRLHPTSGHLAAGRSVTVRVHVSRRSNSRGEGIITFAPGGTQVHVTWRPDAPDPDPTPSPTPTGPGPGDPSTPPGTHRPGDPSPTQTTPPSSPEPPPSGPPPSNGEPDPPPSTEPPSPTPTPSPSASSPSAGSPGTSATSSP